MQPSNAGGAYQARDTRTGRLVFVKEARPHNGYTWDGVDAKRRLRQEYDTLTAVHRAAPGVCPRPLELFTEWEHDFLVMEHVDGVPLTRWINGASPVLDSALGQPHALGLRFGDVSPGNVIVAPAGEARLIDFESVTPVGDPPARMGTAGFAPPPEVTAAHPAEPLLTDRNSWPHSPSPCWHRSTTLPG
ncbi:hypothetical protein ABZX85_36500 [Streptomyces sp. NPDC004539]|uniref:hypothetical protein n=1 Tax=Streptomyces sp. NPDC004539 TaxID=3154280 RepID=UPI0033AA053D